MRTSIQPRRVVAQRGTNAGFYELAGADEIRAYYGHVMARRFLPSGRVRYFPSCEWSGDERFTSRLTGESWRARVARRLVDARYNEGHIPATSPPPREGVRSAHAQRDRDGLPGGRGGRGGDGHHRLYGVTSAPLGQDTIDEVHGQGAKRIVAKSGRRL